MTAQPLTFIEKPFFNESVNTKFTEIEELK